MRDRPIDSLQEVKEGILFSLQRREENPETEYNEELDEEIPVQNEDGCWWISAYSVCRCYGGAEEGGWWYNAYECLSSIPCKSKESIVKAVEILYENYAKRQHGDIYSVLGGEEICFSLDHSKAELETRNRPRYE